MASIDASSLISPYICFDLLSFYSMNVFYCHFTNMYVNNLILFLSVDDLDISPDFYEYFSATFPVLHQDPSLWCVSAWNDNGKVGMVSEEAGQRSKVQCCTLDHMTCAHSAPLPPFTMLWTV